MPDRIPVEGAKIGVNDVRFFDPVLPQARSAGESLGQLSRSLLQLGERRGAEDAERAAIEAAGVASITKVGDRYEVSTPMPEGAGRIYAKVYENAIDARLLSSTVKDFERSMVDLQARHYDDPQAFAAEAQGLAQGYIKAADPRIAAKLEIDLAREFGERFRGLAENKLRRDRVALIDGIESDIEADVLDATRILATGTDDAIQRATVPLARVGENIGRLNDLGEVSDEGAMAKMRVIGAKLGPEVEFAQSAQNLRVFTPLIKGMSDEEVARVQLFAVGATDGGTITLPGKAKEDGSPGDPVVMGVEEFEAFFPSRVVRNALGSVAGSSLNARIAEQRAALEEQRFQEQMALQQQEIATAEALLTAVREGNHDPALGYSKGEVAALEGQFAAYGSVFDQMSTKEGRTRALAFVAGSGFMPEGLKEYIDGQVLGGNVAIVSEFVADLQSFNGRGTWTGQMAYEQLSPQTRATLEYDLVLRRAGIPADQRLAQLQDARRNRLLTDEEVREAFGGNRGQQGYTAVRSAQLSTALGVTPAQVAANPAVTRDYDTLMRFNLQLYNGDTAKAAERTATMVKASWSKSRLMVGGIGPAKLVRGWQANGIMLSDLQKSVPPLPELQGATFANGRLTLRPASDSPTGGYGVYWLVTKDAQGRALPGVQVDMDDVMTSASAYARARREKESTAALDNMELPKWNYGTDANGVKRYIHRDEYRRLLKERRKK